MDANEYQQLARRTLIDAPDATYSDHEILLVWSAIGPYARMDITGASGLTAAQRASLVALGAVDGGGRGGAEGR